MADFNILITAPFSHPVSGHEIEAAVCVKLRDGWSDTDEPDSARVFVCRREWQPDAVNMLRQRGAFAAVFPRDEIIQFIDALKSRFGNLWVQDNSGQFADIEDGRFVPAPRPDRVPVDGQEFAKLRIAAGLTIPQAARMLDTPPEIWEAWENGTRHGWDTGLARFKSALGM